MKHNTLLNLSSELQFHTSRSGGKGGQNVNKTSTKVELRFNIKNSAVLTEIQKTKILAKINNKLSKEGDIIITVQETRSQLENKTIAIQKFYKLIDRCLIESKKRVATKPSKASKEKRIKEKKILSERKKLRSGY